MTTWLPRCILSMVLAYPLVSVAAPPDDAAIARLIKQLDSDDFDTREAAGKQLETFGEPIRPVMEKVATTGDDLEIRARAVKVIQALNAKLQVLRYDLHSEPVLGVAFTPDGRRVISASLDGTVRLIEAGSGKLVHCFAHPGARNVAVSPDGALAISIGVGPNQSWRVWDLESGKEVSRLAASEAMDVVFAKNGHQVLWAPIDNSMRLFDSERGKEVWQFSGHTALVHGVDVSPDGKQSLSASFDGTVGLWSNETGKELKRMAGHTGGVWTVAFAPDGKRAISGGQENVIKLWNLETGCEIRELKAHTESVHSLKWSPDGRRIISGSYDRTIILWDAETFEPLHRFEGHTDVIYSVAFSPDGKLIVSGGKDKTVRVWRVPK